MATRDPQLVHTDVPLTNLSVGYQNQAFVGENLAPTIPVDKQSDKYYVFTRREGWSVVDDLRFPGASANELPPMTLSSDQYYAQEHALVGFVHDEETENEDSGLDEMADETERVTDTILMGREKAIADMALDTSKYASGFSTTLSGTAQFNDYTNSDPITIVKTGREVVRAAIGSPPNVAIMGRDVFNKLEDHPKFVTRIQYTVARGLVTADAIASLLGVDRIVVADVQLDTANIGQPAATLSYLWGKNIVLAYVAPNPGRKTKTFMYEFAWKYSNGLAQNVERQYDWDHKSTKIRVSRRYQMKFTSKDVNGLAIGGYLIKNAVA